MPWFRADDGFSDHPKVKRIPRGTKTNPRRAAACGLWTLAGCWSAKHLTEGFVPAHMIDELGCFQPAADDLVTVNLWEEVEGGYRFHQWEDRQPSRAQVEADRAAAAERQKRARDKARESRRDGGSESRRDEEGESRRDEEGESRRDAGVSHGPPGPALPKPFKDNPPSPSGMSPPPASRIPDDFAPTPELLAWVRAHCPDVPASEHENFVDYWRATPGAKGRKLDWPATWRVWMRRQQADIRSGRRPGAGPRPSTTDQRVAQAQSLRERFAAIDQAEADQAGLATVTRLAIGGTPA